MHGFGFDFSPESQLAALKHWQAFSDPMKRYCDVPKSGSLLQHLMLAPYDPYLLEFMEQLDVRQVAQAVLSGNPFHGNAPAVGTVPALQAGLIPVCRMEPTHDVLALPFEHVTRNLLCVGPTGTGKTNWLKWAIYFVLLAVLVSRKKCLIVAFDRKSDLVDCEKLAAPGFSLCPLRWHELQVAMLQPVAGMSVTAFATSIVQMSATVLNLFASRRLMSDTLDTLYRRPRAAGTSPLFSEWMEMIEAIRVTAASRLGQYREAALFAMKSLYKELGGVLDYVSSDMLDRIFALRGCVTVITSGLSVEAESLLASLFINHAYQSREAVDPDQLEPLMFILDDALPLVRGSAAFEAEGGINPFSTWAFMSRSRKIGFVVSAQNFSLISPALRNNTQTVLCFGSYGRDADELAHFMSLNREQAAKLPVLGHTQLQSGEPAGEVVAIARSICPQAVYGLVPYCE